MGRRRRGLSAGRSGKILSSRLLRAKSAVVRGEEQGCERSPRLWKSLENDTGAGAGHMVRNDALPFVFWVQHGGDDAKTQDIYWTCHRDEPAGVLEPRQSCGQTRRANLHGAAERPRGLGPWTSYRLPPADDVCFIVERALLYGRSSERASVSFFRRSAGNRAGSCGRTLILAVQVDSAQGPSADASPVRAAWRRSWTG